jgi:hypothetical protein
MAKKKSTFVNVQNAVRGAVMSKRFRRTNLQVHLENLVMYSHFYLALSEGLKSTVPKLV